MARASRSKNKRNSKRDSKTTNSSKRRQKDSSEDAIKAAERIALTTFGSGLKLAAAFGTVAAKTASLALASLASGAEKFSELVKEEALRSTVEQSNFKAMPNVREKTRRRAKSGRKRKLR